MVALLAASEPPSLALAGLMAGIAALGFLLNLAVSYRAAKATERSQGKVEGIVQTSLAFIGQRIDEHKRDVEKAVDSLRDTDKAQWQKLDDHGQRISRVEGAVQRANGKAAGSQ